MWYISFRVCGGKTRIAQASRIIVPFAHAITSRCVVSSSELSRQRFHFCPSDEASDKDGELEIRTNFSDRSTFYAGLERDEQIFFFFRFRNDDFRQRRYFFSLITITIISYLSKLITI